MHFGRLGVTSFILMFAVGSALGQDVGGKVSTTYSLQPKPQVTVTNNYSSGLTGMVIVVSSTVAPYRKAETIWLDPGINFRKDRPLEKGASASFPVGPVQLASQLKPELLAVTFEDGTSAGDAQWLAKLHLRRKAAYDEITTVSNLLNQALTNRDANDQIVGALNQIHNSLRTSNQDPEATFTARFVVEWTLTKLKQDRVGGVVGDPQKTIPVIMAGFAEWRGALRRYDRNIS